MDSHICNDDCKGRRGVKCFLCKGNFFLKCFGVDQSLQSKITAPDSFIKFVCGKCQRRKRSSLSTPVVEHSGDSHLLNNNNIKLLIDKLSALELGDSTRHPSTESSTHETNSVAGIDSVSCATSIDKLVIKATDKLNKLLLWSKKL